MTDKWDQMCGGSQDEADAAAGARDIGDPRTAALVAVRNMAFDWYCPTDARRPRVTCRECVAEVALDAYEAAARFDHGITS